jgi:hypothetical protein
MLLYKYIAFFFPLNAAQYLSSWLVTAPLSAKRWYARLSDP